MKTVQTTFAWFCAVMLVISGVAGLLLFNIERQAFSAETFQQAFERQNLYARMPAILAGALQTSIAQNGNTDPFLTTLSPVELEAAITDLLPPEDLKALSDETLDSVFSYLNDETDSVSVSLLPIKSRLAGPAGAELVTRIINAQPDCTLDQLLQMGMGFFSGDIALCKPPAEMMGLITPMLTSQMQVMTTAIPDRVVLVSAENNPQVDPRIRLSGARLIMKLSPILPLLFLVAVTALAVRSLTDWLKWWGYPFLAIGGIGATAALLGAPLLGLVIQAVIRSQAGFLPPILISALGETVSAVSRQILSPVVIQGGILGFVGLGMVVTAAFLRKR
jgi:hypothetical protein